MEKLNAGFVAHKKQGECQRSTPKYQYKESFQHPFPFTASDDGTLGEHNFAGSAFVGYGKTFGSTYYLGLEAFGNYTNTEATDHRIDNSNYNGKLESNYSFGAAARFGYLFTPRTMGYFLLGADYANFQGVAESNAGHSYGKFDEHEFGFIPSPFGWSPYSPFVKI